MHTHNADQLLRAAAALTAYAKWQEIQAVSSGTIQQQRMYAAGTLPDDDLLSLARTELFRGFDFLGLRRWRMMTSSHLPRTECAHPTVTWDTLAPSTLTAMEWMVMEQVTRMVNETIRHAWVVDSPAIGRVESKLHRGTCGFCGVSIASATAMVAIPWAGRILSREYVL